MTTTSSRPFIAAMQVRLDGDIVGSEGESDWVDSWADGLDLLPNVDAFVLGSGMFPDYARFCCAECRHGVRYLSILGNSLFYLGDR